VLLNNDIALKNNVIPIIDKEVMFQSINVFEVDTKTVLLK